jgi:Asp-tRNA(Asn)/Glu-tRNA(Gln) amidotransferase A subunit family amidase
MTPKPKTALQLRLDAFEELHRKTEPKIHAFVAEEGRFARLRKDAGALERKYRKRSKLEQRFRKTQQPALFGLLLGVKDMFHVDGFETHAGSRLPAKD